MIPTILGQGVLRVLRVLRVLCHGPGKCQVDSHWDYYFATDQGACWGRYSSKRARAVLIGVQLWLSYLCFYRSRRQTPAASVRNARLVNCDRSCVTDPGRVAALTVGGGPCESWFRVLLFSLPRR